MSGSLRPRFLKTAAVLAVSAAAAFSEKRWQLGTLACPCFSSTLLSNCVAGVNQSSCFVFLILIGVWLFLLALLHT